MNTLLKYLLYSFTFLLFACGNDDQHARKAGQPLDGVWGYGANPQCDDPNQVFTFSRGVWKGLGSNGNLIELAKISERIVIGNETYIKWAYLHPYLTAKYQDSFSRIYYIDDGNKISAKALEINNMRVELEALGIDIETTPILWLTRC